MKQPCYVGIDVGSEKLDIYIDSLNAWWEYPNTPAGCRSLIQKLRPLAPERIVLEPTGNYEKGLLKSLLASSLPAVRAHGALIRCFAGAMGQKAKSDPIDAKVLATFGRRMEPEVTELPPEDVQALRELRRYRDYLKQQITNFTNHLRLAETTLALGKNHLAQLKAMLAETEAKLKKQTQVSPEFHKQVELLCSVPGVGFLSAVAILTEIPEIGTLSPKRIAALTGLAPFVQKSGKHVGQARIAGGRERARKAMYMPALAATRYNPIFKEFYQRLKGAGKPAKKALTACMRKLLCRLNAMIRDQQPWAVQSTS